MRAPHHRGVPSSDARTFARPAISSPITRLPGPSQQRRAPGAPGVRQHGGLPDQPGAGPRHTQRTEPCRARCRPGSKTRSMPSCGSSAARVYSAAVIVASGVLPVGVSNPRRMASSVISRAVRGRPASRRMVRALSRYVLPLARGVLLSIRLRRRSPPRQTARPAPRSAAHRSESCPTHWCAASESPWCS